MKLGILGGSFNPIHLGHLTLAEEAREFLGLEKVLFIPCAKPPHKPEEELLAATHRLEMVRLATQGNPFFEASDIEIRSGGVSYSVQTVRALREASPKADLILLIGSDALQGLNAWKEIETLFTLCQFAIAERPRYPIQELPPKLLRFQIPQVDISSRDIRQRVREGRSVRYLVPKAVGDYLKHHQLYRAS